MKKKIKIACTGSEYLSVDDLDHFQGNLKTLTDDQAETIKKSIIEFGFTFPVFVWKKGKKYKLLDGHQRCAVVKKMIKDGWSCPKLPVSFVQASDEREARSKVLLAASRYARIDETGMMDFIKEVDIDIDYILPFIDLPDIDLEIEKTPEEKDGQDSVPEPKESICKNGDLWELGEHRLLCGDATQDIERLMAGEIADMVLTDPPYGMNLDVDYDGMFRNDDTHKVKGKRFDSVIGDDQEFDPRPLMGLAEEVVLFGADYYCQSLPSSGSWYCWDKRTNEAMDKVVGNCFELIWSKKSHKREVARILWSGHHGMAQDDTNKRVHPTQKPVKLYKWLFDRIEGALVLDPYLGSGTTLIAAEQLGRKCYGMEIDPGYCDVIIARWEEFTGEKAILMPQKIKIRRKVK